MPGAAMGLLGGGGGGSISDSFAPVNTVSAGSPGYSLGTNRTGSGISSILTRKDTEANRQYDERFPRILGDYDTLRGTIQPGFSDIRKARLGQVENARLSALGNLRDSFQQRRLQGSSFAMDKITQAEKEFGQQKQQAEAQSFLEELQANDTLLQRESQQVAAGVAREFAELGIASNAGMQLAQLSAQNDQFLARLRAEESAASGEALGSAIGFGANAFGLTDGGLGSLLGGSGGLGSLFGGGAAAGTGGMFGSGTAIMGGGAAAGGAAAGASSLGSVAGTAAIMGSSKGIKDETGPAPDVLAALLALPIQTWRYKPEHGDPAEHIGPYAEDFQEAFGLGDGKTIAVVDVVGVLLKAIQELSEAQHG